MTLKGYTMSYSCYCYNNSTSQFTGSQVYAAAYCLSHVQLFATPWTVAQQAPLSMGILQAGILEWVAIPSSRESSQLRGGTQVSCIPGGFFTF